MTRLVANAVQAGTVPVALAAALATVVTPVGAVLAALIAGGAGARPG